MAFPECDIRPSDALGHALCDGSIRFSELLGHPLPLILSRVCPHRWVRPPSAKRNVLGDTERDKSRILSRVCPHRWVRPPSAKRNVLGDTERDKSPKLESYHGELPDPQITPPLLVEI